MICHVLFRLLASHFLVLVPQKVTTTNAVFRRRLTFRLSHAVAAEAKEDDTQPSRPSAALRCWLWPLRLTSLRELAYAVTDCCAVLVINKVSGQETRPSSLHTLQAAAELR